MLKKIKDLTILELMANTEYNKDFIKTVPMLSRMVEATGLMINHLGIVKASNVFALSLNELPKDLLELPYRVVN